MNRSSSFVILDESEDISLSGSEDLVESLLIDASSKGSPKTTDALPTSTLTLKSQCDVESSSWAVLEESETAPETSQTPGNTFLMKEAKNEEEEESEAEVEDGFTMAAPAELPVISREGEVDAPAEPPAESGLQRSSLTCLLENAFDFIQFLSDLFSHFELRMSERPQSTEEDLKGCRKSLSWWESRVDSLSKSLAAANDKLHSSDSALSNCLRTLNWRQEKIEQYKTNLEQLQDKLKKTTASNEKMQKTIIELQDKVIKYQSAVFELKETVNFIERNSIYVPGLDTLKQLVCSITRLCPPSH